MKNLHKPLAFISSVNALLIAVVISNVSYADHDTEHTVQALKGGIRALEERVWDCENGKGDCLGMTGPQGEAGLAGADGAAGPQGQPGVDATNGQYVNINIKDFGAIGDDAIDDTAAIQAAIDSIDISRTALSQRMDKGGTVFFPAGEYLVNAPIRTYSGINLIGVGPSSRITEGPGFSGNTLISLSTPSATSLDRYQAGEIYNMEFVATSSGVAAIRQNVENLLNSHFHKLYFSTPYGVIVDGYTQKCVFEDLYSYGPLEQFIHLVGNENIIQNIDKEGGVGLSSEPLVLISPHVVSMSTAIYLKNILLEGGGSPSKAYIKLDGCNQCVLDGLWAEATESDGYLLKIVDSGHILLKGSLLSTKSAYKRIKIERTKEVVIEYLSTDSENVPWSAHLEVDDQSFVRIKNLETRRGNDLYNLDALQNVTIDQHLTSRRHPIALEANPGISARSQVLLLAGQNLLMNPSFEAGSYGWQFSGSGGVPNGESYIPSEVGSGLMAYYTWVSGTSVIYQSIEIGAELVGRAMTFSVKAKISSSGRLAVYASGAGIDSGNNFNVIEASDDWHVLSQTVIPQSAGTLYIGVRTSSPAGPVSLDDASLSFGTIGTTNLGKFTSLEIGPNGGQTITYAASLPNSGSWKQGDIVYNNNPSAGTYVGWVCVTGGTPGQWKPFGAISN
ncbi:MAG: hypothetical protein ACI9HY_000597 [Planctomycetaceae bacterium]|jgi:hypothetical protein